MAVELLNPDGLPKPELYRQVAVASGTRTVYLAGQVARNAPRGTGGAGRSGRPGRTGLPQRRRGLAAVGGSFDDVAKITLYFVDWSRTSCPRWGRASSGRLSDSASI